MKIASLAVPVSASALLMQFRKVTFMLLILIYALIVELVPMFVRQKQSILHNLAFRKSEKIPLSSFGSGFFFV